MLLYILSDWYFSTTPVGVPVSGPLPHQKYKPLDNSLCMHILYLMPTVDTVLFIDLHVIVNDDLISSLHGFLKF